jgi:hypothetical protein
MSASTPEVPISDGDLDDTFTPPATPIFEPFFVLEAKSWKVPSLAEYVLQAVAQCIAMFVSR